MVEPFYAGGLRFSCSRCSACCRGEPGYVFLAKDDVLALLRRRGLAFKGFFRDYCTLVDVGTGMALSLREVSRREVSRREVSRGGEFLAEDVSKDCVFWGEEGCGVYEDRPAQCRTYPFWSSIVDSEAAWREEAHSCPGIGSGELRSRVYIEERLLERRGAGPLVLSYGVDPECTDEDTILGGQGLGPDSAHAVEG
jgi:Fe-S-cluster containining protein